MDNEIKQVLKKILSAPIKEKKNLAFHSLNAFKSDLKGYDVNDEQIDSFIDDLTGLFVSMDQSISEIEYEIYLYASKKKVSMEEFTNLVNNSKEEKVISRTFKRVSKLDIDTKSHLLVYATVLMSANGSYSQKEIDIIDRIMSIH